MELLQRIDPGWTLFLDRDGVINYEKENDYIRDKDEFIFYPGVLEAMKIFATHFDKIIIVTNQRGIGRGLMSEEDLTRIHEYMKKEIEHFEGRIDAIYFAPDPEDDAPRRKPNPGMAYDAQRDYPGIDPARSIIAGNNLSDMMFGRNSGMHTVFIRTTHPGQEPHPAIDLFFDDLFEFAAAIVNS